MSSSVPALVSSVETLMVDALPDADRQLLRQGAVLRYITRDLAAVVTGSQEAAQRLIGHPMVQAGGRGSGDEFWTMSQPLRKALVTGWEDADKTWARVARTSVDPEALYARLATAATREGALADLESHFNRALRDADVPLAHDLLRLLDEWPVVDCAEGPAMRQILVPRLRRHGRALRDREATRSYLERDFERPVRDLVFKGDQRWMLHLHGPGGRGKTMFLRNLLGRVCPASDIPVARIDFDYVARLSMATTEPWRLLLSVAAQLDPQLPGCPFQYMLDSYGGFRAVPDRDMPSPAGQTQTADSAGAGDEAAIVAAHEVPRKFRIELARVVGDRHVVVALDTIENVLHTDGAEFGPVLNAFDDLVHGVDGEGDERVPGLRLILNGRFDLASGRPRPGHEPQARVPGFRERWVGPDDKVEIRDLGNTSLHIGQQVVTLEVPGFSAVEARRFLTENCHLTDPALIKAIAERAHDNPMKLALLAEYVRRNPDVTAEAITAFEDVDLFYLVDRVVDRIADGRVQWLLRWGALMPVVTRESIEKVIWPALDAFAEARSNYDDVRKDGLPAARAELARWEIPPLGEIRQPGAQAQSWEKLLDYAANSSWVSVVPELPQAVIFHPEVREPLRKLLQRGGHPAYDDIHRRSLEYWSGVAETANGQAMTVALSGVLFHAYEPWQGADHDGDRIWRQLLDRHAGDRAAREGLARALLELVGGRTDDHSAGPSADVRCNAHLEVAEAIVDTANRQRTAVSEGVLASHLAQITDDFSARERRRVQFLHAALEEASGRPVDGWRTLGRALNQPPPTGDPTQAHLSLMADWAGSRTPPHQAIDVAERLFHQTSHNAAMQQQTAAALARGLLDAERWQDALEVAGVARLIDLQAAGYVHLGDADSVLDASGYPSVWRARAALLRSEPTRALAELNLYDPYEKSSSWNPDSLIVQGQAHALLQHDEDALNLFSLASSGSDPSVSAEASLETARLLARLGRMESSLSYLVRLMGFSDVLIALRATLLYARINVEFEPDLCRNRLEDANSQARRSEWLPPSVALDLAVTTLAVRGAEETGFDALARTLGRIQGRGARLLGLRDLSCVQSPTARTGAPLGERLRSLVEPDHGRLEPAILVLARVELERVLGDPRSAAALLDRLERQPDDDGALHRAINDARARLRPRDEFGLPGGPRGMSVIGGPIGVPDHDLSASVSAGNPVVLRIRTSPRDQGIRVEADIAASEADDVRCAILPNSSFADGAYTFARYPAELLDEMERVIAFHDIGITVRPTDTQMLHLHITDESAARLPWELAVGRGSQPLLASFGAGVLRRQTARLATAEDRTVLSRSVIVGILNERRDRGQVAELLNALYDGRTERLIMMEAGGSTRLDVKRYSDGRIFHLVADCVGRRRVPALQLPDRGTLTAESLAGALRGGPRLLILDLVLPESDHDAAEQLMIANAFCWHFVRNAPDIAVLCGVFGGANDGIGNLERLARHLDAGDPLDTIVANLRRTGPMLPGGRHPLRDFVSLSTETPNLRFGLE